MTKKTNQLGRESVLKELKSFAANGLWDNQDFGKVLVEETDRGCIIILVTILDDILEAAISRQMQTLSAEDHDRIFGFGAPLGSFSARIRFAHALQIIDKQVRQELDILRAMRNP